MERRRLKRKAKKQGGKMILFGLPFITVLREGLEGVVFLGGIGLSEPPPAIAGGAFVGLIIGSIIGEHPSYKHQRARTDDWSLRS
jgi:high-affinity iron transporter